MPLKIVKEQRSGNYQSYSVIRNELNELSTYLTDPPIPKSYFAVHYKPKIDRLQQMKEHAWVTQDVDTRLQKHWHEVVTVFDGHKQRIGNLNKILSVFSHM